MKNERTCIVCRAKQDASAMLRIGKSKDGSIAVGTRSGRGAYICKNASCIEKALKTNALNRVFRKQIDKTVLEELKLKGESVE